MPYAYREMPSRDRRSLAEDLEALLAREGVAVSIDRGTRLGFELTAREAAPRELLEALRPHLPPGMFDVSALARAAGGA